MAPLWYRRIGTETNKVEKKGTDVTIRHEKKLTGQISKNEDLRIFFFFFNRDILTDLLQGTS